MKAIPFDQTRSLFGNVSLLVTDVIRIFENDLKQTISLSGCWPVCNRHFYSSKYFSLFHNLINKCTCSLFSRTNLLILLKIIKGMKWKRLFIVK